MNKPATGTNANLNRPGRPSLYAGTRSRDSTEIFSILDAIEPSHSKSRLGRRLVWGMLLVSAIAVAVIGAGDKFDGAFPLKAWIELALKRDGDPGPVAVLAPPVAVTPAAAIDEPSVATIITEAPQDKGDEQVGATTGDAAGLVQPAAMLEAHAEEQQATHAKKPAAAVAPKHAEKTSAPTREAKKAFPRENAVTKKSETKVVAASAVAKGSGKDKDVDLIAALLSHVSRPGSSSKDAPQKTASVSAASRSGSDAFTSKRDRTSEPNRDVIIRTPSESTDSLVKRCLALGFFEGELCRMRICSGMWGKDPACPSNAQTASN